MSGWICLHRKLLNWEWYSDNNTKILFIHCLLRANHTDAKWKGKHISRGQFITSLESLSRETCLSVSQVRTSISKLKSTGEITDKSQARSRVITVVGYDSYQDNSKQNSRIIAAKSQDNRSEIATDNNDNNENNENKKTSAKRFVPPSIDEVLIYCTERKNNVNAQEFVNHYEANGWMRGKTKIKDWKACVRTWEQKNKNNSGAVKQRRLLSDVIAEQRGAQHGI